MTERLYWRYPQLSTFTARAINISPCVEKEGICDCKEVLVKVWLDQTLFYPEGGGQPYDKGFFKVARSGAEFPVTKAMEEDGNIVHYVCCSPGELDSLLSLKGYEICGEIDWQRRFDHMQQHTGQHILSSAFVQVLGGNTTGFHLSQDYASIDLDLAEISQAQVQEVERVANEVVFGNIPVQAVEYTPSNLPPMVRRRIPKETDIVRMIEIGDFDACACGGTHVISTGQVGLIKVCEIVRAHGGVRVVFRCGWRALADYQQKNESVHACARLLSVAVDDVDSGIHSLMSKLQEQEQETKRLQGALIELEADIFSKEAKKSGGIFIKGLSGKESDELRYLAKEVAARSGKPVIIFIRKPRFTAVIASPTDTFDAKTVARRLATTFEARGGGNKVLAQVGSREALDLSDEEISKRIQYVLISKEKNNA